jgi:hypothetical protein
VDEPRLHRGWVSLYAGAFALMLMAGAVLVAASLGRLESIRLLWVSAWLSVAAIAVALASVLVTRRR